jgi:hypothetical protein
MEITIWKSKGSINTTIYQTYKASGDKKATVTIVSTNKFIHAIKIAFNVVKNYKWLLTSSEIETVKSNTKKYYPKNNNKKK